MPARRSGGLSSGGTTRRKHSLGNLRRAHPASGATWNVQVVRGKMSSKCLWHACRALVLGLTLMLVGAGMATLGYYADQLSMGTEVRGNATVRVKNDLKGFHLNNFSYVGPIVMGFGGFIVVASCVMTFEARDSAAKVVPARLRVTGGSKTTVRSNQSSSASQRRAIGLQLQSMRWDQSRGPFRSSPGVESQLPHHQHLQHHQNHGMTQLDREALTAEFIKFSKSLSSSARFSPQFRRLTYTGSVPNLSIHASQHPLAYSINISHLLSPNHKSLLLENKRNHRNHRHHHHHHHHNHHNYQRHLNSNGRQVKSRGTRISNSLIQRNTRDPTIAPTICSLLQPPPSSSSNRLLWHAASFDESARIEKQFIRNMERTKRSDTAKRHVLARQKPIEHEEDRAAAAAAAAAAANAAPSTISPLGNRRSSTMSDSSYSGRWTARCASIASQASSADSRRIQVDLHSPEVMPKSILRSPKRYNSGPSTTPSVEKEFRSQLSVCSEPPPMTVRQLSGQSSLEPCFPEENSDSLECAQSPEECISNLNDDELERIAKDRNQPNDVDEDLTTATIKQKEFSILKKFRPDCLPLSSSSSPSPNTMATPLEQQLNKHLHRSNSSRTFYRPKPQPSAGNDDSIFYIRSAEKDNSNSIVNVDINELYDSIKVISERRTTLLRVDSEKALAERKSSAICLMQEIPERAVKTSQSTSIDIEGEEEEQEQEQGDKKDNADKNEDKDKEKDTANDIAMQIEEKCLEAENIESIY